MNIPIKKPTNAKTCVPKYLSIRPPSQPQPAITSPTASILEIQSRASLAAVGRDIEILKPYWDIKSNSFAIARRFAVKSFAL
jgi:hypothetical protein